MDIQAKCKIIRGVLIFLIANFVFWAIIKPLLTKHTSPSSEFIAPIITSFIVLGTLALLASATMFQLGIVYLTVG